MTHFDLKRLYLQLHNGFNATLYKYTNKKIKSFTIKFP